jgi:hypothetical protein
LAQEPVASALMRGWRSIAARLQASDAHRPLAAFVDLFAVLLQLWGALGCALVSRSATPGHAAWRGTGLRRTVIAGSRRCAVAHSFRSIPRDTALILGWS